MKPALEPIAAASATAVAKGIEKATSSLLERTGLLGSAKRKVDEISFVLNKGLPEYLESCASKCEKIKTLLSRTQPVDLKSSFVPPEFSLGAKTVTADALLRQIALDSEKAIISGLAGSGKSVFLKYAFRASLEKSPTYYPIFFELRALNGKSPTDDLLINELFLSINHYCQNFTRNKFDFGLRKGAFFFLLDGYDEVSHELRDAVASGISKLARKAIKCPIIISSRPADEFVGWEGFSEVSLLPFSEEKVIEFIQKIPYDEEKKGVFSEAIREGLYEHNKDFLSNPLLASMMLLTYDAFGEMPEQKHLFYQKCFDVLAREHDTSKGHYLREFYTKITLRDMERAFMFFCTYSYLQRCLSFSPEQVTMYAEKAIESANISCSADSLIRDFRESISILQLDGQKYEFAHSSFQEYFYAKFVVTDREVSLRDKIEWLTSRFVSDDSISMIAEMDRTISIQTTCCQN